MIDFMAEARSMQDELVLCRRNLLMIGSANAERGLDIGHHHPRYDFGRRRADAECGPGGGVGRRFSDA